MLAELPKLLDRNFAIAYLLPSAGWCLAIWGVLAAFDYGAEVQVFLQTDALLGAAFAL
jgi:hypothetical protein